MKSFPLKIVTPDGLVFSGEAESLTVRTTTGDLGVLAGHTDLVAPLGMGRAVVVSGENRRTAACIGGMMTVMNGEVRLVATTFEWSDEIDLKRVEQAELRAQQILENKDSSDLEIKLAEAKLHRALVRKNVARS